MNEELLISQDYTLVWSIYLGSAAMVWGLAWYLFRLLPWAEVRQLLLAVLAAEQKQEAVKAGLKDLVPGYEIFKASTQNN